MRAPLLFNSFRWAQISRRQLGGTGSTQGLYKDLCGNSSLCDLLSQAVFLYQNPVDSSALQCLLQHEGAPTMSPWQAAKGHGNILLRR